MYIYICITLQQSVFAWTDTLGRCKYTCTVQCERVCMCERERYIIRIRPRAFHFNLAPLFYFFTPPYIVYIYTSPPLDDSVRRSSPKIYIIGRGVAATRIDPPGASGPAVVVTQPFVDRTHYSQLPAFPLAGARVGPTKSYRFPRSAPSASGAGKFLQSCPLTIDFGSAADIYRAHALVSLRRVVIASKQPRYHNT